MKANARHLRNRRRTRRNEAQVGIGTMIVFIATILTAAVAAAVVIDTANNLQEKSQRTGMEATAQVANNLVVTTVEAVANDNATALKSLNVTIALAPGSKQVDVGQMLIRVSNGTVVKQLKYDASGAGDTFNATALRDPDTSFTNSTPVLTAGDLVVLNIDLGSSGADIVIGPRKTIELTLQPEVGSRVATELRSPPSLTAGQVVMLR